MSFALFSSPGLAYSSIFLCLALTGLGLPVHEELFFMTAGVLVHRGVGSWWPTLACAYAGVVCGDTSLYLIGHRLKGNLAAYPRLARILHIERQERVKRYFARYGALTLFFVRFLPGVRAVAFLAAGAAEVGAMRFLFFDGTAAALSVLTGVTLGYLFSENLDALSRLWRKLDLVLLVMALCVVLAFLTVRWVRRGKTGGQHPRLQPGEKK